MHRIALAVLMVLPWSVLGGQSPAGSPLPRSDQSGAEAEVRRFLEGIVVEHLSKPDAKELDRIYADQFTSTNASGQVLDKAAVIAARVSGKLTFQSYALDEVNIRTYGDVAVATTTQRIEGSTVSGRSRHLRVLIKRDGRWQMIASQMTKIAEQ
jgi:hypothetical protein